MTAVALGCATAAALAAGPAGGAAWAAAKPQVLVFYSAQGYDQAEATAFQQATGIKVELSDMSTGPLLAKVAAERQHPEWDVVWFDGNAAMATLDGEGALLRGYAPQSASDYNALGRSLLPADHAYFPTGVTAAGVIVYNTKLVPAADAPHTWTDLLKPEFHDAVGMNNPAISGPTYTLVAGFFHQLGVNGAESFFEKLRANGLHTYATNGVTLQALTDGSIKAGIVQDSAALGAIEQGSPIQAVYPPSGVTMLPSDVAINAHAPDMAAAKAFVQFVLSPAGQKVMQDQKAAGSDSLFQPVTTAVKPLASRPANLKWNRLNPVWAGEHQAGWTTWFTDEVVR